MGEVVRMLDEFLNQLEADQKELAARFQQGKVLAGLEGSRVEAPQGLDRIFKELGEVRERVLSMRANAADLEKKIGDPRVLARHSAEPPTPPAAGWVPGASPLSDAEIAEAGERLVGRLRIAPQPMPVAAAAGGDVAAIPSGSWESQPRPNPDLSVSLPPPKKSSDKQQGDDVADMASEDWKR